MEPMDYEETIEYDCKENDNHITLMMEDGELDEIWVGCELLPEHGQSVIGLEDLRMALLLAGYEITRTVET